MSWPVNQNDYNLTYNVMMAIVTLVPAFFLGPFWALMAGIVWSTFWFWDLYLRPWLFPESDAIPDEMTQLDRQFQKWVESQQPALVKRMENYEKELNELKGKVVLKEGVGMKRRLYPIKGDKK